MDNEVLFFFISLIALLAYRATLSILLLSKKRFIIDEKFYITFFYISLSNIVMFIFNNLIVGIVLTILTPIILTLYVGLCKNRVYWIINGANISEGTFNNHIMKMDKRYEDMGYLLANVQFFKKKKENKIKVAIRSNTFEEKQQILKEITKVCKDNTTKANKSEVLRLFICIFAILLSICGIIIVLFS